MWILWAGLHSSTGLMVILADRATVSTNAVNAQHTVDGTDPIPNHRLDVEIPINNRGQTTNLNSIAVSGSLNRW